MVAVIIIAVVFTGLAGILFYAAPRGKLNGLSNVMYSRKRTTSMAINVTLTVVMIGFGLVIPAIFLIANHDRSATAGTGGIKLTANEINGRELFGEHCSVCHTLSSANAIGKIGPNLDQLKPSYSTIMHTLQYGCLQEPQSALWRPPRHASATGTCRRTSCRARMRSTWLGTCAAVAGRSINVAK